MNKKVTSLSLALVLLLALSLVAMGCPPPRVVEPEPGVVDPRADWPKGVTIGTASIGGVYHIWGGGWGEIITEVVGVPASVEVTGGPVHNIRLVQAEEAHFGFATNAPLYEGWYGLAWAEGVKHMDIRAVFPMYTSGHHIAALTATGIDTLAELAGRRVGIGPAGGTTATYFPGFLEVLGIEPADLVHAGFGDLVGLMRDGLLCAVAWVGGLPMPALLELEVTHEVTFFGYTEEEAAAISAAYPFFTPQVIKVGTYRTLTTDILGLAVWNMAITHKDMDESFVYEVVRATFANVDRLIIVHPTAREVSLDNVPLSVIPYHPGAVRYFKGRGIAIPAHLLPPPR